jgi:hypothetical protein
MCVAPPNEDEQDEQQQGEAMIEKNLEPEISHMDRRTAEIAARREADRQLGGHSLCAWFDGRAKEAGPQPACTGETADCAQQYAENHGGKLHVTVGPYQFYFAEDRPAATA